MTDRRTEPGKAQQPTAQDEMITLKKTELLEFIQSVGMRVEHQRCINDGHLTLEVSGYQDAGEVFLIDYTHTSASQQRIEQAINILEMQIGCSNMLWEDGGDSCHDAYHQLVDECKKAIALLQAGDHHE